MKTLLCILLALLPMYSLAVPGAGTNATKTPKTASGIRGVVVRWPIKPSTRIGETNSAPMPEMTVSVQPEHGGVELVQKTDKNGRFEFNLPPGKYAIVPVPQTGLRLRTRKQDVEVKEKGFTEVVLTCDTGMR